MSLSTKYMQIYAPIAIYRKSTNLHTCLEAHNLSKPHKMNTRTLCIAARDDDKMVKHGETIRNPVLRLRDQIPKAVLTFYYNKDMT